MVAAAQAFTRSESHWVLVGSSWEHRFLKYDEDEWEEVKTSMIAFPVEIHNHNAHATFQAGIFRSRIASEGALTQGSFGTLGSGPSCYSKFHCTPNFTWCCEFILRLRRCKQICTAGHGWFRREI